jgi:(p)ppGpp synthase/HD superfamily hydrolase
MGFVDGSEPCPPKYVLDAQGQATATLGPNFLLWTKKDQFVLSWLNASLSEKVKSTTFGVTSAKEVWDSLSSRFASHSKTRISHLQRQLQSLHQGSKSCTDYLETAKQFSVQLAAVGQPVTDDALIGYVVGGLHPSFNPVVTSLSVASRYKSLTFSEFQDELFSYELLSENQNAATTADSHHS